MTRNPSGDVDDLIADRPVSKKHLLAGVSPHRPLVPSHSNNHSPSLLSPASNNSSSLTPTNDLNGRRLPYSERFKNAEHLFLSSSSSSSSASTSSPNNPASRQLKSQMRTPSIADKEELERFLDTMKPLTGGLLIDDSASSSSLPPPFHFSPLHSVDEKQPSSLMSSPSNFANAVTIASPPPSSRPNHSRRPSYMQATQQEMKRQQELREAQMTRESRKAEELAKSTRRVAGKTNTDLYQAQQADLEARRLAQLEKEEAERKVERAKFLARFMESPPITVDTPVTSRVHHKENHNNSSLHSSGAQTSRSHPHSLHSPSSAASHLHSSSSSSSSSSSQLSPSHPSSINAALLLQQELQRRQNVVLADTRGEISKDDSDHSDDDNELDDDDSDDDMDEETRKNTIANTSKVPAIRFVNAIASPHHGNSSVQSSKSAPPVPLTAPLDDDGDKNTHNPLAVVKRDLPTMVAQIYDPAVGRLLSRHEGGGHDAHRTGLDLLLESTRVKRKIRNKKPKLPVTSIQTGFGRMTEAQIERSMEIIEKKRLIEQQAQLKPMGFGSSGSNHSSQTTETTAKKSSFLPSLWRKITGS